MTELAPGIHSLGSGKGGRPEADRPQHGHRSHLGGLAALARASGATVHAHEWEADIVGGERHAQPVTILPRQKLRLWPFRHRLRRAHPRGSRSGCG